jgi:hypothetical protein
MWEERELLERIDRRNERIEVGLFEMLGQEKKLLR